MKTIEEITEAHKKLAHVLTLLQTTKGPPDHDNILRGIVTATIKGAFGYILGLDDPTDHGFNEQLAELLQLADIQQMAALNKADGLEAPMSTTGDVVVTINSPGGAIKPSVHKDDATPPAADQAEGEFESPADKLTSRAHLEVVAKLIEEKIPRTTGVHFILLAFPVGFKSLGGHICNVPRELVVPALLSFVRLLTGLPPLPTAHQGNPFPGNDSSTIN